MNEQSISFGNPYLSTGSSSVTHIANVPDNDMTDIIRLLELWRAKYPRQPATLRVLRRQTTINNLGISIPEHRRPESRRRGRLATEKRARARRQERVRGIRDRRRSRQPRHRRDHAHERARTDMSEAVISCYKHSCSFLTIDYDPDDNERILITPRSADWSAALWDNDRRRIKAALTITDSDKWGNITAFNAWLPGRNYACMKPDTGGTRNPNTTGSTASPWCPSSTTSRWTAPSAAHASIAP